jgi:uncharacterized protein YecT (DUF1311 family)
LGWSLTRGYDEKKEDVQETAAAKKEQPGASACGSNGTYARLKEVVFEEALKLRASDPGNLDKLADASVVRMEEPVMRSRDEDLNVTVCAGRFILEVPPGAEAAFGGERRLTADIEYSAQSAADGSGLVYQIRGAEPIISKLAAFQLQRPLTPPAVAQPETEYAEVAPRETRPPEAEPEPEPTPPPRVPPPATRPSEPRQPAPAPRPAPPPAPKKVERPQPAEPPAPREEPVLAGRYSNPSFNCRSARTRGERMVCSSQSLAARDRAMSSMFYSAMASADAGRRSELRRTRDRFLGYRDRCRDEACVADAYEGRMREIRDIMEAE